MKPALALLLLLARPALAASAPEQTLSGVGASLGRYPRVTARITFDRAKAESGGMIFAVDRAGPADDEAVRLSEAVILTSGGLLGRGAAQARAHLAPAIILRRARWEPGPALSIELPEFGPSRRGPDGLEHRALRGASRRLIKEGEVVTVDSADGLLSLYPEEQQEREYDLAQAVRAFEGLRDPQSLIHWFEDRAEAGSPLALRLAEELAPRVFAGTVRTDDFERALSGVRQALSAEARKSFEAAAKSLGDSLLADESDWARGLKDDLQVASAESAAVRLADEGKLRQARLESVLRSLDKRLAPKAAVLGGIYRETARKRLAALKGKDGDWREAAVAAGAPPPASARLGGEVYRDFVREDGLEPLIQDASDNAGLDLRRKADRIRALFDAAKLDASSPAAKAVLAAAPNAELLHVITPEDARRFVPKAELLAAVKQAWASYWNAAALGARKRKGESLSAEVLLEAAVPADVSGVVFSRDPATLNRDRVVVEAAFGEREGLDTGKAEADQYVLDRAGRQALPPEIADKRAKLVFDTAARAVKPAVVPPGLSLSRCLTPEQLLALARLARALDAHFGRAVSAEFAVSGGKLTISSASPLPGQDAVVLPELQAQALPTADVAPVKPVR